MPWKNVFPGKRFFLALVMGWLGMVGVGIGAAEPSANLIVPPGQTGPLSKAEAARFAAEAQTALHNAKPAEQVSWNTTEIAPGVTWQHKQAIFFPGQLLHVNVLRIGNDHHAYRLAVGYVPKGRVKTSEFCRRAGAIAGINGGYFSMKGDGPTSYLKAEGKTIVTFGRKAGARPDRENAALVIDPQGRLHLESVRDDEVYARDENAREVVVAGPLLLKDGRPVPVAEHPRHPRSVLGLTPAGEILMVTVDGRTPQSIGADYRELQQLMATLGCVDAINLDGGGSTTLWIAADGGKICNWPCEKSGERPVADVLMLLPAVGKK